MSSRTIALFGLIALGGCSAPSATGGASSDAPADDGQDVDADAEADSNAESSTDASGEGSSAEAGGEETGSATDSCQLSAVGAPPTPLIDAWELSSFYEQHLELEGLPILSSAKVDPQALVVACQIVEHMLREQPEVHSKLVENHIRVAIMSVDEVTTDIPEHADLYEVFPGTDWDERARGLGATIERPASTVGEENLLHFAGDPYAGESIMVHEFGHTIWGVGVQYLPDGVGHQQGLVSTFDAALAAGLWQETYAGSDVREYWAEATQSWFNTNLEADPPDGVHNHVNSREELQAYDPAVAELTAEFYPDDDWVVP